MINDKVIFKYLIIFTAYIKNDSKKVPKSSKPNKQIFFSPKVFFKNEIWTFLKMSKNEK